MWNYWKYIQYKYWTISRNSLVCIVFYLCIYLLYHLLSIVYYLIVWLQTKHTPLTPKPPQTKAYGTTSPPPTQLPCGVVLMFTNL